MKNIVISVLVGIAALVFEQTHAAQGNIPGPPGSGIFGDAVAVLPNGNFVVCDPDFDASASAIDTVQIAVKKGDNSPCAASPRALRNLTCTRT